MTLKTLKRWVFLLCVALCLVAVGCGGDGTRRAVYIHEGYYGWVRIEYGVKGAPKLPATSFFRSNYPSFSLDGLLQTSSELKRDVEVEIYYGTAMEVRPVPADMIHGRISSLNVTRPDGSHFEREFETAFIGPENEYDRHRYELERFRKSDDNYMIPEFADLPRVGNIRH
jgi:hypothetical protein